MIYGLHFDAFSTAKTAGISWKFIAKTGAIYWKKLEFFLGQTLAILAKTAIPCKFGTFDVCA